MKKVKGIVKPKIVKRSILLIIAALLVALFANNIIASYALGHDYTKATAPGDYEIVGEYGEYLKAYEMVTPNNTVTIDTTNNTDLVQSDFTDVANLATIVGDVKPFYTSEVGSATWRFTLPDAGYYNIRLTYYPEQGGSAPIERKIKINGAVPYEAFNNIVFSRTWGDGPIEASEGSMFFMDAMGNDMKPTQIEKPKITTSYVVDDLGYVTEPYLVYCLAGENTITIESVREPMSIFSIDICAKVEYMSYSDYVSQFSDDDKVNDKKFVFEAEDPSIRTSSSATLYAVNDRTSAKNSPTDPVKIRYNSVGGTKWASPGDWISWDVEVEEAGLYQISLRSKQGVSRGVYTTRKVLVNGEVPFDEALNTKYHFSTDWKIMTLGGYDVDGKEIPFYFYLNAGQNTITLEATLGDYSSLVSRVNTVIDELNRVYRRIIAVTTLNPDPYIDYYLVENLADFVSVYYEEGESIVGLKETFTKCASELREVNSILVKLSGGKSDMTASLDRMAIQLDSFVSNIRTLQRRLNDYSNNISALGTWILQMSEQSIVIDQLYIHSDKTTLSKANALPKANPDFFTASVFGVTAFFKSFFFDYESIGVTEAKANLPTIEVWFLTSEVAGREQANALSNLILDTFDHANVKLKLVSPGVLLPATLAKRGPDVAINVPNGLPINYALRNAIEDISKYEGFYDTTGICSAEEIARGTCATSIAADDPNRNFQQSAMVPYEFNGGYYALPNTQSFLVTFYRTDIFDEYDWKRPTLQNPWTWEDVIEIIPELQLKNLQFYLPLNTVLANSVVNQIFASMLYQQDGTFYKNGNRESAFDSAAAMSAFDTWSRFYSEYSFPLAASFFNRFRTGETPIGIANYEMYNTLMVSAPEIRGKWDFALLPGTIKEDNSLDHRGAAGGTAVVMMAQAREKEAAWEFMKWWTSENTQFSYARELESVLGPAARHNTPNIKAFQRMAWTAKEIEVLTTQWEKTVGVPEVAGGYYTGRNLENAFREVVNKDKEPRETLEQYIQIINSEITRKRAEFGLD